MENQFPPNGHENAQQIFCQHLGRGNRWKRLLGKRRLARAHAGLIVASSGRSKSWLPWSVYKPLCDTSTILTIWILKYLPIIATLAGWVHSYQYKAFHSLSTLGPWRCKRFAAKQTLGKRQQFPAGELFSCKHARWDYESPFLEGFYFNNTLSCDLH